MKANGYQVALAELAVRTGPQQASVAISMAGWKRPRDPGDGVPKYLGGASGWLTTATSSVGRSLATAAVAVGGAWLLTGSHPEKARHQVQGLT